MTETSDAIVLIVVAGNFVRALAVGVMLFLWKAPNGDKFIVLKDLKTNTQSAATQWNTRN